MTRIGNIVSGTSAMRQNKARKIPRRSNLGSIAEVSISRSRMSRDLGRDAPRETKIKGIAVAPAVSIAKNTELCRNPERLKNNSC